MADEVTIHELVSTPPTDMLPWAVMTLITHAAPHDKFLEMFGIDASSHDNTIKVELKINGVEVSPREVFAELERQHENMIKRAAMEMVLEKCGAFNAIADLANDLERVAKARAAESLGVDWKDRW